MTKLQKRMIEDLQLRGMSESTQESYLRAVRKLEEHYSKSPNEITEEELRQYFLYLKNEKKYFRSASTIALCGIKFLFDHTLKKKWSTLTFVRAPKDVPKQRSLSPGPVSKLPSRRRSKTVESTNLPRFIPFAIRGLLISWRPE
jgi:site-specific recombinase XerD